MPHATVIASLEAAAFSKWQAACCFMHSKSLATMTESRSPEPACWLLAGYPCPPYKLLILDEADSMTQVSFWPSLQSCVGCHARFVGGFSPRLRNSTRDLVLLPGPGPGGQFLHCSLFFCQMHLHCTSFLSQAVVVYVTHVVLKGLLRLTKPWAEAGWSPFSRMILPMPMCEKTVQWLACAPAQWKAFICDTHGAQAHGRVFVGAPPALHAGRTKHTAARHEDLLQRWKTHPSCLQDAQNALRRTTRTCSTIGKRILLACRTHRTPCGAPWRPTPRSPASASSATTSAASSSPLHQDVPSSGGASTGPCGAYRWGRSAPVLCVHVRRSCPHAWRCAALWVELRISCFIHGYGSRIIEPFASTCAESRMD